MTPPLRVLIADDQTLMRSGLVGMLAAHDDLDVVGEAADGMEAVALVERLRPDVVVMDIRMPRLDGIEATRRLRAAGSSAAVLVLTTFDLDEHVYQALRAGAAGFLLKDAPPQRLADAVRAVAAGDTALGATVMRRLVERYVSRPTAQDAERLVASLTAREREVLDLVVQGLSNAEVSGRLHLSEATVKTHVTRVLAKLGVRGRVQAVVLAYESGLAQPGG
jgi:DNA-binding NarL/FixJ family response regulator